MPVKSVREMGAISRRHHSLGAKVFRRILVFSLIVCMLAVAFGFFLYYKTVQQEFISRSYNISRTAAREVRESEVDKYVEKTLNIYEVAPHDLVENQDDEDYKRLFSDVPDEEFNKIRKKLDGLCKVNDAQSVYFAALDMEKGKLIYILDSDQTGKYCQPGKWEELSEKDADTYRGMNRPGFIERYMNGGNAYHAVITNTEEYGRICSACTIVGEYNDYDIGIFADTNMDRVAKMSRTFFIQYLAVVLALVLLITLLLVRKMKKKIVEPINEMAKAGEEYGRSRKDGSGEEERFFGKLDISTGDELENLSLVMKDMEEDISVYEKNMADIIGEKERMKTEMDMATRIQSSMVPHTFPPFPERSEFDIYASMDPAREVGGDFYDFFFVDDDHLAVVMADVAGKGIPAALFMMASKILIKTRSASDGPSPAKILEGVNDQMCASNNTDMFVTVWLGILEISTGRLTAASAGHEYPVLKRAGGKYEIYKDKRGFVLGGMEDSKYTDYVIDLEKGDSIFLYTDGIAEASNGNKELFGTDRMTDALNEDPDRSPEETLSAMKKAIETFTEGEEQFDDITMMCLEYAGPADGVNETGDANDGGDDTVTVQKLGGPGAAAGTFGGEYVLDIEAKISNLYQVLEFVDSNLEAAGCPLSTQMQIDTAVEEIFVNISSYAYGDETGRALLKMKTTDDPKEAVITISDSGIPYDPLAKEDPDITLPTEEREIGGLGVFMVKEIMDEIEYEYKDGRNVLTLKKKI